MKDSTRLLLDKGERAIAAAEHLTRAADAEFAAGRAYYGMFYVAQALLNFVDLPSSKHGGVHTALGEHFVKTDRLDARFHRWLLDAFQWRIIEDYGLETQITPDEVTTMIDRARQFLSEAERIVAAGPV